MCAENLAVVLPCGTKVADIDLGPSKHISLSVTGARIGTLWNHRTFDPSGTGGGTFGLMLERRGLKPLIKFLQDLEDRYARDET